MMLHPTPHITLCPSAVRCNNMQCARAYPLHLTAKPSCTSQLHCGDSTTAKECLIQRDYLQQKTTSQPAHTPLPAHHVCAYEADHAATRLPWVLHDDVAAPLNVRHVLQQQRPAMLHAQRLKHLQHMTRGCTEKQQYVGKRLRTRSISA
jgi:hypothetical protein